MGHDVVWAGAWDEDPGDEEILAFAHREARVLVTLDKDFGELAILHDHPHSGILRLVNLPARRQAVLCERALAQYGPELEQGAIVTVEPTRVRIRPPRQPG
jgi:predicted nuclease of predicted toxin-antitoxin system